MENTFEDEMEKQNKFEREVEKAIASGFPESEVEALVDFFTHENRPPQFAGYALNNESEGNKIHEFWWITPNAKGCVMYEEETEQWDIDDGSDALEGKSDSIKKMILAEIGHLNNNFVFTF